MNPDIIRADPAAEYRTDERCHILEMSNSVADEDASVARARVEPGETTALHRLKATVERYVILDGKGRVEIGGNSTHVQPGDVVIIPAEVEQRIANTGAKDLVFLCICTPRFTPENYVDMERSHD